jgi:hypothetical protein
MVSIRLLPELATRKGKYNDPTKKRKKEKEKKRGSIVLSYESKGKPN